MMDDQDCDTTLLNRTPGGSVPEGNGSDSEATLCAGRMAEVEELDRSIGPHALPEAVTATLGAGGLSESTGPLSGRLSHAGAGYSQARQLSTAIEAPGRATVDEVSKSMSAEEVFAWLGWSPESTSLSSSALQRFFPGALPAPAVLARARSALQPYQVLPAEALFAQSLCPLQCIRGSDSVRNLSTVLQSHWRCTENYNIGGLGGVPFAAATLLQGLRKRRPERRHLFLHFGPRVTITSLGEVHCADSLASLFAYCTGGLMAKRGRDELLGDDQLSSLSGEIASRIPGLSQTASPAIALAVVMFEMTREKLYAALPALGSGSLFILGGIHIDLPGDAEEHFLPLGYEAFSKTFQPPCAVDLLETFDLKRSGSRQTNQSLGPVAGAAAVVSWIASVKTRSGYSFA